MTKTLQGIVHGKLIELLQDLGYAEGQKVEIQVTALDGLEPKASPTTEGLDTVYAILGERYNAGALDAAARHDEHQP
jgi:hypothetical protein